MNTLTGNQETFSCRVLILSSLYNLCLQTLFSLSLLSRCSPICIGKDVRLSLLLFRPSGGPLQEACQQMEGVACPVCRTPRGPPDADTVVFFTFPSAIIVFHELPQAIMANGIYELVRADSFVTHYL